MSGPEETTATAQQLAPETSYLNPVYPHNFPDPFVLKYCGEYWAYCTGFWHDGRCFGILHSRDLVNWREAGSALDPLPGDHSCYWAPEVWYDNGRFYLYYSVGNEEIMHIRVAVAPHPAGPFLDSGRRLTQEPFAIDAHVFEDDDGARYLFYATDFLDHSHIGTGTVRDRLLDAFTLAGAPQPVTRARYDWQVYDPQRAEKGGVRWHTVEGPFVLKRKGLYYQMFSGGNWQNVTYGVSYAVTRDLDAPEEWTQVCDGERVLPILRTRSGEVIGPGHNSVVRGPDNIQLFCIYHRWADDQHGRVLAIDRLDWAGDRLLALGPTTTNQPAPDHATISDFFSGEGEPGEPWTRHGGRWRKRSDAVIQTDDEARASLSMETGASHFVVEISLQALSDPPAQGAYGLALHSQTDEVLQVMLMPSQGALRLRGRQDEQNLPLPPDFQFNSYHLLRLEVNHHLVHLQLDGASRWQQSIPLEATDVALVTEHMTAAFAGFALTVGWQDLFTQPDLTAADLGWSPLHGRAGNWTLRESQLWAGAGGAIVKGPPLVAYELVVNARLADKTGGYYGFYPAILPGQQPVLFAVRPYQDGWALQWPGADGIQALPLPTDFEPFDYRQFRFRKQNGALAIYYETQLLGQAAAPLEATSVGLHAEGGPAAFDMVRLVAL